MPTRLFQGALLIAAVGAVVLIADLLGTAGTVAGLVAMAIGTVLAAPEIRVRPGTWWNAMAAGTVLCLLGTLLGLATETIGGLLTVLGAVAVIASAALTLPLE